MIRQFLPHKVESYYKSRKFKELLLTIFAGDGDAPLQLP